MPVNLLGSAHQLVSRGKMIGALICNGILAAFAAIGLIMDLVRLHSYAFAYFSDVASILVFLSSVILGAFLIRNLNQNKTDLPRAVKVFRFTATSLLVYLFFLVVLVLGPTTGYKEMMLDGSSLFLNFLAPVLSFFSFVMFEQEPEMRFREIWWTPVAVLLYGVIVVPLVYYGYLPCPYSLFDVSTHEVWVNILVGFLLLAASFFVSWLVFLCDKRTRPGEEVV